MPNNEFGVATLRGRFKTALAMASAVTATLATVMSAGAMPAGATTSITSEVRASDVVYWGFVSANTHQCLSTYASGTIRSLPCSGSAQAQQWHWIDSRWNGDQRLLKNRWTGKCLIATNPVTSGTCEDWTSRHWRKEFVIFNGYWIRNNNEGFGCLADEPGDLGVGLGPAWNPNIWYIAERDRA
ncbi:hypothetical protein [Nonomuraea diastatica]|uniref:Uncharacterized protein n=1 Tax=Nonomuraea diastatica TaxID=1848329 RepID=A0A4R4W1Y9_9ACTN|nr:hypothetical protein [Nonomuraea diastatica]TDD11851.1 hypothetical protein E1294_44385 [Nonomuraea diastatica]